MAIREDLRGYNVSMNDHELIPQHADYEIVEDDIYSDYQDYLKFKKYQQNKKNRSSQQPVTLNLYIQKDDTEHAGPGAFLIALGIIIAIGLAL